MHKKKATILKMKRKEMLLMIANKSFWDLPLPSSISYFWNFGSTLGFCLIIQLLTGLFLSFHYSSLAESSFSSIVNIMQEVWGGWIIRLLHMNGASMFFLFIYLHLFRGMFFLSSVHKKLWLSGIMILITLMAISFLGYVLPWGQMSFWAVAVITNLFSVVPIVGTELVKWIWGGFSVGAPTLNRFYSFHFLFPFILTLMVGFHLAILHFKGSSNPMGINSNMDKIEFQPYFTTKDLFFILGMIYVAILVSFYLPYSMGDAVNNVPANPMQTPIHIQPEWYFLPSYAILRALPSKTSGVMALALSIGIYFTMPMFHFKFSTKFSFFRYIMFWTIIASFLFLMKMGALPAEEPFVMLSKMGSMIYFSSILIMNI